MGFDFERHLRDYFPFGMPISKETWDWLDLAEVFKQIPRATGTGDVQALRRLAAAYNAKSAHSPETLPPISPGQLVTASTIVELLRYVVLAYCYEQCPGSLVKGMSWTAERMTDDKVKRTSRAFVDHYPPRQITLESQNTGTFLEGRSPLSPNSEQVTIENMMLMLSAINPAFKPFRVFFDDSRLQKVVQYRDFVGTLADFFETQPTVDHVGLTLFKTLVAPIEDSPDSLEGQLAYIQKRWAKLLPKGLLQRIILATDVLREERYGRGFSEGSLDVPVFQKGGRLAEMGYPEWEAFSRDADWMSNVVLIAKSTYVWLDQLSKKYQRPIHILSDIPNEELDRLAYWGFNGLWLIGVWERSRASQTIKQIMGNPEALSSAYSLYDYNIAQDLGGDVAYENLRERAQQRGIRLSADMVPNHMGIYSRWMIEHPDWFIQLSYPPFPVYQYTGANLSDDPRVVLQIEDGYWQHRDAAVVLKRTDSWTGDVRYIYHGNDGTNMPWNDTAQLNFLNPEVREAVIQTILHVARKFSIIRFDAAMTLAKRHYQRLWFPPPGEGGAIPSRAEHGLTREEFDAAIPVEFWREVVDRIAQEVPDTLLLAEAFWLMEGYFVRTLGMHRVYNSAFMNMLKMEENSKYRQTIKNVLEFSPEILKRFVNFMNNPDERTAVEQFGKGDKYFGVAMMLVTMPGLPMIGHGQIEGYAEKYGMEYRRAYWDEQADEHLVWRHEAEIFPLMRKRYLFSGAANFALFDFVVPDGWVDENVFAYTNRSGDERALVLYNNAYNTTRGAAQHSTAINVGPADNPHLVRRSLVEALGLKTGDQDFYVFEDYRTRLQYIRSGRQLADNGLFAELHGYQYHVFLNWREVFDNDGSWRELMHRLDGAGVQDIFEIHSEHQLEPILAPFRAAFNAKVMDLIVTDPQAVVEHFNKHVPVLAGAVARFLGHDEQRETHEIDVVLHKMMKDFDKRLEANSIGDGDNGDSIRHILSACLLIQLANRVDPTSPDHSPLNVLEERYESWHLRKELARAIGEFYGNNERGHLLSLVIGIFLTARNPFFDEEPNFRILFNNRYSREFLMINNYQGVDWFNRERWVWLVDLWRAEYVSQSGITKRKATSLVKSSQKLADSLIQRADASGFKVAEFIGTPPKPKRATRPRTRSTTPKK